METHPDARWRRTGLRYAMRDGTWWAEINEMAAALVVLHSTLRGTPSRSAVWDEVGRRALSHPGCDPERCRMHRVVGLSSGTQTSRLRYEAGHADLRMRRVHERLSPSTARAAYWREASRRESVERLRRQAGVWLREVANGARLEPWATQLLRERILRSRTTATAAPGYLDLPEALSPITPHESTMHNSIGEDRRG